MEFEFLKSDIPVRSYGLLCSLKICDFEKYKTEKTASKVTCLQYFEQISCQKITKNMFGIKFSLETFTGSSRHFCDSVKISKLKTKITPKCFSPVSQFAVLPRSVWFRCGTSHLIVVQPLKA